MNGISLCIIIILSIFLHIRMRHASQSIFIPYVCCVLFMFTIQNVAVCHCENSLNIYIFISLSFIITIISIKLNSSMVKEPVNN